ncbi:hypothetical protein [Sodalis sp.]|uniref:hypothetical protein n=1 Tax=Sodalis sp. (in: enterobacteria) TaxID=1898979 RepID=UPI003873AAEA
MQAVDHYRANKLDITFKPTQARLHDTILGSQCTGTDRPRHLQGRIPVPTPMVAGPSITRQVEKTCAAMPT